MFALPRTSKRSYEGFDVRDGTKVVDLYIGEPSYG